MSSDPDSGAGDAADVLFHARVRAAPRALVRDAVRLAGSIAIVLLTYFLTATSLAQRDRQLINAEARRLRGGVPARRARSAGRHRARRAADGARAAVRPRRRSRRRSDRAQQARGWDPEQLETASLRLVGRHAGPGGQEHRGARRSARALPRRARHRHALDRRHRADGRLAGDAVGGRADPAADPGRPPHHPHRPHRRARAAPPGSRGGGTTRSTS